MAGGRHRPGGRPRGPPPHQPVIHVELSEEGYERLGWRLFDRFGRPVGAAHRLEPEASQHDGTPFVAATVDGGFRLAWTRFWSWYPNHVYELRSQRLDAGGEAQGEVAVIPIEGMMEAFAGDGRGGYLAAHFATASGTAVLPTAVSAPFAPGILGVGSGAAGERAVGGRSSGAIASWRVQRLAADGTPAGAPVTVVASTDAFVEAPAVVPTPEGGFALLWGQDWLGHQQSFVRAFDAEGQPLGPALPVTSANDNGSVAAVAAGRGFAGFWVDGSRERVQGSLYDGAGGAVGAVVELAGEPPDSAPDRAWRLAAAAHGDQAVLVWRQRDAEATASSSSEVISPTDVPGDSPADSPTDSILARRLSIGCSAGPDLCLLADRFVVQMSWRTRAGATGSGTAVPLAARSGAMWFFAADNFEVFVKMLDACSYNGSFWVFAAGLTNVEVAIEVTDTTTGARRSYANPLGQAFPPILDTAAFATCP